MKKMTSALALFMLIFSAAQSFDTTKMNAFMKALDDHQKFMGAVAVAKDGNVIYQNAIGFADAETQLKNKPDTKFRIGSISKTFTAVLVLKAAENQKLSLTDPLSKFFPQVKNSEKITIEQLLNHRSGIFNVTNRPDYLMWNQKPATEAEMVNRIVESGSASEPGTKTDYSNSNYILLTYILEKVHGKPFAKILEQQITKPLKLNNTYYGGKINPAKNEAHSYSLSGTLTKESQTDMSVPAGAGALVSSTHDLAKFAGALFEGKLLKPETLAAMMKMTDGYGYGLFMVPFNGHIGYGHNGGIDGFQSALYYFADSKTAFVMLSNGSIFDNNKISVAALSGAYGQDITVPDFTSVSVSQEDLQKLTGVYASAQIPLKIEVRAKDGQLFAQATGQNEFPLDAKSATVFGFDTAGIELVFKPEKGEMTLNQSGMSFLFTKEK